MSLFVLWNLISTPSQACTPASGTHIVINEFLPDPPGADSGQEWVELAHVGGGGPADLAGWAIRAGTRTLTSGPGFPPTVLEPGAYLVLGATDGVPTLGNAGSGSADAVQLVDCEGHVADTVVYGGPNADGFVDDSGDVATSLGPVPAPGASLGRLPDGVDTDRSAHDFVVFDVPTPGAANPGATSCMPGGDVVLNELLPNPAGVDADHELVELYAAEATDVGGWSLVVTTRSDREAPVVLPEGAWVDPFLVVGGAAIDEADLVVELDLGNGDGTDGLRLVDCEGALRDSVVYGEPGNADGIVDDQGFVDDPWGDPAEDDVLARRRDGVDTDGSDDWVVRSFATPGATNELSAATAVAASGCQAPPEVREPPTPRRPTGCGLTPASVVGPWFTLLAVLAARRATSTPSAGR